MSAKQVRNVVVLRAAVSAPACVVAELSDEALLAACGVGDGVALGALYDRHHDAVFRLAARLLAGGAADVDDVVQSTFIEAWRSAHRYRGNGSVRSFLYGIAVNLVRRHRRSGRRARVALDELQPPSGPSLPSELLLRAQQIDQLTAALAALPHDLRAAYVLCDLEDMSGVDAARLLGTPSGTLWRRLHEARRALREALEGDRR